MWLLLAACLEPFGADRHDLVGFRIAAVSVPPAAEGDVVTPRAAVITDGRAWSAAPVDLAWYWVSDPAEVEAIEPLTPADAAGPSPLLTVPPGRPILAVVARRGVEDRRAFVQIARPSATLELPELSALYPELHVNPGFVEPGGSARLAWGSAEATTGVLVRWMATAGTFSELDRHATDWTAADLVIDGDEVETRRPLPPGPVTILALALGEPGEADFRATDVHVGEPGPGLVVAERFVPTDVPITAFVGAHVRGTLVADDASSTGLRLSDPALESDPGDFGAPALRCLVPREGPFDPGWLLQQICGRDALIGASVVVRVSDVLVVVGP